MKQIWLTLVEITTRLSGADGPGIIGGYFHHHIGGKQEQILGGQCNNDEEMNKPATPDEVQLKSVKCYPGVPKIDLI